jgi:hypothetical protein
MFVAWLVVCTKRYPARLLETFEIEQSNLNFVIPHALCLRPPITDDDFSAER